MKIYAFINDNEPKMNCIAYSEAVIKKHVENWDTTWEEMKNIQDVTAFYDGTLSEKDIEKTFENLPFEDLRKL